MNTSPRIDVHIICQKCQKTVERRMLYGDPKRPEHFSYIVSCHGQKQELEIPKDSAHGSTLKAFEEKP
jgi:hypothetical protein